jgi:uncharacterized protein (TIGR00297 family)
MQIIIGIIFGIIISGLAWRMGSLSTSGAVGAAITGSFIFGLGGIPWGALLLTFFITSSILSKTFRNQKEAISEKFSKGSKRDWGQVSANGGLGALLALVSIIIPNQPWVWFAFAGAMAAVNADTWATELGILNPQHPRLINSGKIVEPGTSGGISLYGMLSTLFGASLIGLVGAVFSVRGETWSLWLAATLGGVCGSLFDSLLGASVQAIYHCLHCDKETERHPHHSCGTATEQVRGWGWLNNDLVNFLASVVGALVATGMWWVFF